MASTYNQTFVTGFHLKDLPAYEGTKNKTKIKMGTASLERCHTNRRIWEESAEEELWEDIGGEAWLQVDQNKVEMDK